VKLDKSKEPIIRSTHGGLFRVILFLEGTDARTWKHEYDEAARDSGVQAHAINDIPPWAISVTVGDGSKVQDQLEAALSIIGKANTAYSERSKPTISITGAVSSWWEAVRIDRPPLADR
jgi:hypothetical protein